MSVDASLPRLRAKVEAWPLKSVSAFQLDVLDLRRGHPKPEMLDELRPWGGGRSDEVMWQMAEWCWFTEEQANTVRLSAGELSSGRLSLGSYLARLANRYLVDDGSTLSLRHADLAAGMLADAELAQRYRWLSLQLPPDLLVSAYCSRAYAPPLSDVVTLTSPGVRSILAHSVAQTHLHIGAALPFSELWTSMMLEIGAAPLASANMALPRVGAFFGSEPMLRLRLVQAGLCRLAFAEYLRNAKPGGPSFLDIVLAWLMRRVHDARWPFGVGTARELLLRALGTRSERRDSAAVKKDLARSRVLYAYLTGPLQKERRKIGERGDLLRADPIAHEGAARHVQPGDRRDSVPHTSPCPESVLAWSALCNLSRASEADPDFIRSFWRYQRVRCAVYSLVVEEPGTSGMDWFVRHYRGMSALRGAGERIVVSTGFHADARGTNLGSFEVRSSPEETAAGNRLLLQGFADQMLRAVGQTPERAVEFGVVLHFIKSKSESVRELQFGRYARWYRAQTRRAVALGAALRRDPRLLVLLRGIDACTLELAIPNWPFVRLFERVREAAQRATRALARRHPTWNVPTIRATFHAGEDYRCLSDGLRRMHELLEFGILTRGDRVGHGLALGEDPQRWSRNAQAVSQPREERLDDLLWELDRYAAGDFDATASRLEYARDQASALAQKIYGEVYPLEVHRAARKLRHQPSVVDDELGYPFTRRPSNARRDAEREARWLLFRYLTDKQVFRLGREPIDVRADANQVKVLQVAQAWLRGVYSSLEITIETNPSSNLVVGDYHSLDEHPVFRLSPIAAARTAAPCLRVSVNTDDPAIVTTSLADEYAHQYYALLTMGVGSKDALGWLDAARQSGWDSRFTLPVSARPEIVGGIAGSRDHNAVRVSADPYDRLSLPRGRWNPYGGPGR